MCGRSEPPYCLAHSWSGHMYYSSGDVYRGRCTWLCQRSVNTCTKLLRCSQEGLDARAGRPGAMTARTGSNEELRKHPQTNIKNVRVAFSLWPGRGAAGRPPRTSTPRRPPWKPQQDRPANSLLSPVAATSLSPPSAADGRKRLSIRHHQLLGSHTARSLNQRRCSRQVPVTVKLASTVTRALCRHNDDIHKNKTPRSQVDHLDRVFLTSVRWKDPQCDFCYGTRPNRQQFPDGLIGPKGSFVFIYYEEAHRTLALLDLWQRREKTL